MKRNLYTFACLLLFAASFAQSPKAFIKKVAAKYKNMNSISFTADFKWKHYDREEVILNRDYRLVRAKEDTLFGYYFWYAEENPERGDFIEYYNNGQGYVIKHGLKAAYKFDMSEDSHLFKFGGFDGETVSSLFMQPDTIMKILRGSEKRAVYRDTVINKSAYLAASVFYPNESSICCYEREVTFYFNRETQNIEKISWELIDIGGSNYHEWTLKNITFNKETSATLQAEFDKFTGTYVQEPYIPHTSSNSTPLETGTPAPVFTGKTYPDFKDVSLTDYKGKIVVLHFWYISEQWYTKAMPTLNTLQQKYKDDVVVLGINPFDNYPERLPKMHDFVEKHGLVYPIVLTGRDVLKPYNLFFGPELYIVDRDGIIQHYEWIVIEKLEKNLDDAIKTLLQSR